MKHISITCYYSKGNYFELYYLASYYRWLASRSRPATGNKSPLNGKPYSSVSDMVHHIAERKACLATAKVYLLECCKLRNEMINSINL